MGIRDVGPDKETKPDPVEVVDVTEKPVPFLRPLDWIATTLRSFRERPLPGTYSTEARPTFDLFGTSMLEQYGVESIAGGVGNLEVFGAKISGTSWRQYLSVAVVHDDGAASHEIRFTRIVQDDTLGFPAIAFAVSDPLATGEFFTARNVSVPPEGRISARLDAIGAGAQMTLTTLFVEMDVGEPYGNIS